MSREQLRKVESAAEQEKKRLKERHGNWFERQADRLVMTAPWLAGLGMIGAGASVTGWEAIDPGSPEGVLMLVGLGVAMIGGRMIAPEVARKMSEPKELRQNLAEDKKKQV